MTLKQKNLFSFLFMTVVTGTFAMYFEWDLLQLLVSYWAGGVFIALFASLAVFFYESKGLGGLLFLILGFFYFIGAYLLFQEIDLAEYVFTANGIGAFVLLLFLQELFLFLQQVKKYGKPFSEKLKGKSDPLLQRTMVVLATLLYFFLTVAFLAPKGVWLVLVFIVLVNYFQWHFSAKSLKK